MPNTNARTSDERARELFTRLLEEWRENRGYDLYAGPDGSGTRPTRLPIRITEDSAELMVLDDRARAGEALTVEEAARIEGITFPTRMICSYCACSRDINDGQVFNPRELVGTNFTSQYERTGHCSRCIRTYSSAAYRCDTCTYLIRCAPVSHNGHRYCRPCFEPIAEAEGLEGCGDCNAFGTDYTQVGVNRRVCDNCVDAYTVLQYNANPMDYLTFMGEPKDNIYYGVELEVEVNSGKYYDDVALQVKKSVADFAVLKRDGSLNNGFEVVSAPMSMDAHKSELWDKFFDGGGNAGLRAAKTDTCGMHVHISRKPLTTMTVGKIVEFIHSKANSEFIELIAGRSSNHYCGFANDHKATTALPKYARYRERYNAVNLLNNATVEVRIFKGTVNRNTMFKNLEFCQALVNFCRTHSIEESKSSTLFVFWVTANKKDYPNLFKFLKARYLKGKKNVRNYRSAYTVELNKVNKAAREKFEAVAEAKAKRGKVETVVTIPSPFRYRNESVLLGDWLSGTSSGRIVSTRPQVTYTTTASDHTCDCGDCTPY